MERTNNLHSNEPALQMDKRNKLLNAYRLYIKSMASLLLKSADDAFKGSHKHFPSSASNLREPAAGHWRHFQVLNDDSVYGDEATFDSFDLNHRSTDFLRRVNSASWERQIAELIEFEAQLMTLISRAEKWTNLRSASTGPYTLMTIRQVQAKYSFVSDTLFALDHEAIAIQRFLFTPFKGQLEVHVQLAHDERKSIGDRTHSGHGERSVLQWLD
jgi:hypothetical protein